MQRGRVRHGGGFPKVKTKRWDTFERHRLSEVMSAPGWSQQRGGGQGNSSEKQWLGQALGCTGGSPDEPATGMDRERCLLRSLGVSLWGPQNLKNDQAVTQQGRWIVSVLESFSHD